ncbi:putative 7 alpha-cephem-methoxylase [Diaporthe sp. PMI_573]|nr:putative 7 alpha-cephem-methoxylase [Diaporthaceae sp. PMI_573]
MAVPAQVEGRFSYLEWEDKFKDEKPFYLFHDLPPGTSPSNFRTKKGTSEVVHNLRGIEDQFNLDQNGFSVMRQDFCLDTIDDHSVNSHYLPSLEVLLRDLVGPESEIFFFDWRIRSSSKSGTDIPDGTKISLEDRSIVLEPVKAVHVDQSKRGAINRVLRHFPDRAEQLLAGRVRIINIWRPLRGPVECNPLGLLDGSTVAEERLAEVDVVRESYVGEAYYPLQDDRYRWYFIHGQTKEEVLIMKMYDSSETARAKCCPHAAFSHNVTQRPNPRESIEARALVFTPK